jgi:hypothetical protein
MTIVKLKTVSDKIPPKRVARIVLAVSKSSIKREGIFDFKLAMKSSFSDEIDVIANRQKTKLITTG